MDNTFINLFCRKLSISVSLSYRKYTNFFLLSDKTNSTFYILHDFTSIATSPTNSVYIAIKAQSISTINNTYSTDYINTDSTKIPSPQKYIFIATKFSSYIRHSYIIISFLLFHRILPMQSII